MDGESLKWLVGQGEGLVLAVLMFMVYRKDATGHAALWERHADQQRQHVAALMALMERQVATNTELRDAILAHRIGGDVQRSSRNEVRS